MPLFDHYVMVDWTGGNARSRGKPDAIWLATGARGASQPDILNPASRTEAVEAVRMLLEPFANPESETRALVCFDFAYGYPNGFAASLPAAPPSAAAWRHTWNHLARLVKDDLETKPGRRPSNRSNRFDAANAVNKMVSPEGGPYGPFWCLFEPKSRPYVPQARPSAFRTRNGLALGTHRITDTRADSDTPFRLFGTGSVGSQVLTGIPCLMRLRFDEELAPVSAVWPFETGWATGAAWLATSTRIIHAEIYPSVREPLPDSIKDRGQVRAMWEWARNADALEELVHDFAIPAGIRPGTTDDVHVRHEEGWILGCPSL